MPFGEIMKNYHKIFWPPNEEFTMSVLDFTVVDEAAHIADTDDIRFIFENFHPFMNKEQQSLIMKKYSDLIP